MESLDAGKLSVPSDLSIREAMEFLDITARQMLVVKGLRDEMVGLVTDGDIRRGLLAGVTLDQPVSEIMNKSFHSITTGYEPSLVAALMSSKGLRHVPVVDRSGRAIEVLFHSSYRQAPGRPEKVLIMAGGRGSRLRPLTDEVPKPMLKVGGVPILELIIRTYASQGFRNFIVAVGYLGDKIRVYFGDGSDFGVEVSYIEEAEPLGTAGIFSLLDHDFSLPLVVSNADVISSIDLGSLLDAHLTGEHFITIASRYQMIKVPFGVLETESNRLVSWNEKPELPVRISAGIYVVNSVASELLPKGYADMPDLVRRALEEGLRVGVHNFDGLWIDIGSHDTLQAASDLGKLLVGKTDRTTPKND